MERIDLEVDLVDPDDTAGMLMCRPEPSEGMEDLPLSANRLAAPKLGAGSGSLGPRGSGSEGRRDICIRRCKRFRPRVDCGLGDCLACELFNIKCALLSARYSLSSGPVHRVTAYGLRRLYSRYYSQQGKGRWLWKMAECTRS